MRISPEGKVVGEVRYPTRAITCPVFVGTELWVTTAAEEDEGQVESRKYGGGVFRVEVGVGGCKEFEFRLERGLNGVHGMNGTNGVKKVDCIGRGGGGDL